MKIMVRKKAAGKPAAGMKEADKSAEHNAIMKFLGNRRLLLSLAVLVAIILVVTWPSRFGTEIIKKGIFDRSLEKLDTCKTETDQAAKNNCYRDLAFSMNKTYFCGKVLNSSSITSSCYAKLAVDADSRKLCELIQEVKARSYCTALLAINRMELPLCGNVDDIGWRNYCYAQIALISKKHEPCIKIEGDTEIADCYVALAKNISYGPTCAYILDQEKKDGCFLAVGVANADPLLCAEIAEPANRWTCYHRVARKTGNAALCDKVPVVFRQNCVDAVKEEASQQSQKN
ncbi:hypothetical protein HYU16_03290 [Candidatus Woesearchaeota archaeon]|nr:hypothetical protein [Candidatus Woesearchaeota archaeon]